MKKGTYMIAILMSTYNGCKYISETIQSIFQQSYDDYKIYIHDDGSVDMTNDIIEKYRSERPDRIVVVKGKSFKSATLSFLYLLKMVDSDWYMFADQDDVWNSDKLRVLMDRANQEPESSIVPTLLFSDMKVVDLDLKKISNSFFYYTRINPYKTKLNEIITQNVVPGCACMFNNKLKVEALKYTSIKNIVYHDWWVACVAAATGKVIYVNKILVNYRQHGDKVIGGEKDNLFTVATSVRQLLAGNQRKKSHDRVKNFVRQACELKNVSFRNDTDKKMINDLEKVQNSIYICKLMVFIKYRITRSKRNLWMYLSI